MSSKVRRGRVFFLVLATIILLDQLASIVLALSGGAEQLRVARSIVIPLAVAYSILSLWQGEKWCRRFTTAYALLHGGHYAFVAGLVTYQLVKATPPDKADVFMEWFALPLAIPFAIGAFYIFVGLALLLSPSLKAFLEDQDDFGAAHPLGILTEWLRGKIKREPASPELLRLQRELANLRNPPELTRKLLESLGDHDLHRAVVDYVRLRDTRGDPDFDIFALPRGFQAVYSTSLVEDNMLYDGGFHQFFFNNGIDWAFMALEGYRLFGSTELADAMTQAIDLFLQEEQQRFPRNADDPTNLFEKYVESQKDSRLSELDKLFDGVGHGPAVRFIRAHLGQFVTG